MTLWGRFWVSAIQRPCLKKLTKLPDLSSLLWKSCSIFTSGQSINKRTRAIEKIILEGPSPVRPACAAGVLYTWYVLYRESESLVCRQLDYGFVFDQIKSCTLAILFYPKSQKSGRVVSYSSRFLCTETLDLQPIPTLPKTVSGQWCRTEGGRRQSWARNTFLTFLQRQRDNVSRRLWSAKLTKIFKPCV